MTAFVHLAQPGITPALATPTSAALGLDPRATLGLARTPSEPSLKMTAHGASHP